MIELRFNSVRASGNAFLFFAVVAFSSASLEVWFFGFDWHDQQRVGQLILLAVVVIASLWQPIRSVGRFNFLLISGMLLLGAGSSWASAYPEWAYKEWGRYAGMLLLVLLLGKIGVDARVQRWLIGLLAFCAVVLAWMFLVYYLMAFASGVRNLDPYLLFYGFDNPRFLGQFQVLLLPVLLVLTRRAHAAGGRVWALLAAALVVHWCIAWSLAGRGMLAALFLSHMALLFVSRNYWRLVAWQAVAAGMGLAVYGLLFVAIPEWLDIDSAIRTVMRTGLSARETLWTIAWDMAVNSPWLGVGPLHYSAVWNHIGAHPHQVFLQWLAEWGMPATILATILAVGGMVHGARFLRGEKAEPIDAALWLAMMAALLLGQVDGMFVMPYSEGWLAIMIGLAFARWAPELPASRMQQLFFRGLAVLVFCIIGKMLFFDVPALKETQKKFYETHDIGSPPRLWGQGWIPMG